MGSDPGGDDNAGGATGGPDNPGHEVEKHNPAALDFSLWESNRDIKCDNKPCTLNARFIVRLHGHGHHYHGHGFRCERCMNLLHTRTTQILARFQCVICGMCNERFESLAEYIGMEEL